MCAPNEDFLHSIVCFVSLKTLRIYFSRNPPKDLNRQDFQHLTFPVHDGEVGVGGADGEDELVSNERLVRVDGAYCLNQL